MGRQRRQLLNSAPIDGGLKAYSKVHHKAPCADLNEGDGQADDGKGNSVCPAREEQGKLLLVEDGKSHHGLGTLRQPQELRSNVHISPEPDAAAAGIQPQLGRCQIDDRPSSRA